LYYNSSSSKPHGIEGLNIAIVGDILHSRVARSNILLHGALGNKVTLVGPPTLAPPLFEDAYRDLGVKVSHNLREGLEGADVVICLRMQFERQSEFFVPSIREYSREFCVTEEVLSSCCPDAVILHPGPVNRGIEVASDVAFGPRSLVRDQVKNGVALRMAVLFWLVVGGN
ncbi:MAG: aspartate carbamoyltransferase, partial [Candidatus Dadabacteria bacterium]